jgi:hypothetical protein
VLLHGSEPIDQFFVYTGDVLRQEADDGKGRAVASLAAGTQAKLKTRRGASYGLGEAFHGRPNRGRVE